MDGKKPLYSSIIDYIQDKIQSGEFQPEQRVPGEHELADMFNVSRITSRRALSELESKGAIYRKRRAGSFVSAKKAEKTEPSSTGLTRSSKSFVVLLLPFDAEAGGMMSVVRGANSELAKKGLYLTIHNSADAADGEREILQKMVDDGAAGIIYYPYSTIKNPEYLTSLVMNGFPVVIIDKQTGNFPISCVYSDNFSGGYETAKHLIEAGHTRISFISDVGIDERSTVCDRFLGYCSALKNSDIQIHNDRVITDYISAINKEYGLKDQNSWKVRVPEYFSELVGQLLNMGVTALQAANDVIAVELLRACIRNSIKVPDQLAITGFDNLEIAGHVEIPLTTVEQDFHGMGSAAAQFVIQCIEAGEYSYTKETLPVRLIVRKSSGPDRAGSGIQ